MRKLAMVIINYNDYLTTMKLINNIKDYKCLDKIIIVDNCSIDDSYDKLKNEVPDYIDVIRADENKGYAAGLNYGAKYAMGILDNPIIIFSNSDIIIDREESLIKLKEDITDDVKVVGPVVYEHGSLNRGWKRTTPFIETLCNLPLISRYFKKKLLYYTDDYYKEDISIVDVVSGCFFLVDGETLEKVNYFDENTFLYYEEFILSSKMKRLNKKELIDNKVKIIHDYSVSIDKSIKRVGKYKILKNSQKYYVKNYLKANMIELFFLWLTNKLSLIILYIRCLLHR